MEIFKTLRGDALVIHLTGRVTYSDTASLRDTLKECVASKPSKLIVNLTDVPSIDAGGLGLLIAAQSSTGRANISLRLCGLNKIVEKTFMQTNLLSFFTICATEEDAIQ